MPQSRSAVTTEELRRRIDLLPRVTLGHLPTPLEELKRFSHAIGGQRVFMKRDDCTGLAFGGNKTRHNEFILGDALEKGAGMFVWGAGVQSNNCRQTAAACARHGLACHLVLSRHNHHDEVQGNLLLDHVLGATVEIVDAPVGPELDAVLSEKAEQFRAQGRKVYSWDRKVVKPLAAVSYVLCMVELVEQLAAQAIEPDAIYVCSAGSTGAGLALAKEALGLNCPLHNILPLRWPWDEQADIARIANETAELLGLHQRLDADQINANGDYIGPGYGIPTKAGTEAIVLVARTEGVLLDPTYTGKAMAAMIDHVRKGSHARDQVIVFVHTGGTPALFAYRDELVEMMPDACGRQNRNPNIEIRNKFKGSRHK